LLPCFQTPDPLIYQIGLALKAELEAEGAGSRLYAETMANALVVHLLKHYSVAKPTVRGYLGGLSKPALKQIIDYIIDRLDCNLSLAELAAIAQMSPTYFASLFKQSTGLAPHQYVIHRRIERAKQLLLQSELSIAQIANRVGFANSGHFNRHFKKLVGVTPKTIRQRS
jgi:AraC family transcriptional regulator